MDESHPGVLVLRDARELFEQPARRPLDEDYEPLCVVPAAEYLVQVLRANSMSRDVEVRQA